MDRRRLLWLIALLLVPFVVAGVVFGFFSMDLFGAPGDLRNAARWSATVTAFLVALGVVLVVFLVGWIRARKREGGLESGLAVGSGGGGKGEIDALRKNWKESVSKLKATAVSGGGARALSALPWYVIIGPPGGGKSTLLRGSGIDFPVGDAAIRGLQGTRNCDWWFSNVGIFLDTAGRYISDESAQEWGQFLELVRKNRVRAPVNGVIVAVPASTLLEGNEAEQDLDARRIRARLDELIDHLGINFPVWIVLTKVDLVGGFVEFFGQSDPATRRQMMGWTLAPSEGGKFRIQDFEARWETMIRKLREVRPAMVAQAKLRDRAAAYGFPDEMATFGPPLGRMLQRMFAPNVYQETPLLRGVYVTSATQQGTPLQKAAARVREMLGAPPVDADAEAFSVKHAYFVTDLMHERILPDQAMTWTTQAEIDRGRLRRLGINLIGASAAVLLCFLALAVARKGAADLNRKVETVARAESDPASRGVERVEAIRSVYEDFPEAPSFLGLLGGEGSTREKVRGREVNRYRESVLEAPMKLVQAAVTDLPKDAAPDTPKVLAAIDAWNDFEEGAAALRAVADEAAAARSRSRIAHPTPQDILPLPDVPSTYPVPRATLTPEETAKAKYAQEAADLVRALNFRWGDDKARAERLAKVASVPTLVQAKVPPDSALQPSGRIALAVWRNHEWVQGSAQWGATLRDATKDALVRWADEQERRVQGLAEFEKRANDVLRVGLEELKQATTEFARCAEEPVQAMNDLRGAFEAVVETCRGERFTRAPGGTEAAPAAPDWAGAKTLRDRLEALVKKDAALSAEVSAEAVRIRIDAWLANAQASSDPAAPATNGRKPTASEVEKIRVAVKTLGEDLEEWAKDLPKGVPVTVRWNASVAAAAQELAKVAAVKAAEFNTRAEPRLKDVAGQWPVAQMRAAAERLVHAELVDAFLADQTRVGFRALAERTKLAGEVPHGAEDLRQVLRELLSVLPPEAQGALPEDLQGRVEAAVQAAFAPMVAGVEGEWGSQLLDRVTALRSPEDSRAFLRQFDVGGETGSQVRELTQKFEQKWLGGAPPAQPAQGIWTRTVTFPDQYVLLRKQKVEKLWSAVKDFANAPNVLEDKAYDELVPVARKRFGEDLVLDSNGKQEAQRLAEIRQARRHVEGAVAESIARYLNENWPAVRAIASKGRKGEKPTDAEKQTRASFASRIGLAFPGGTPNCGPLVLQPGVRSAFETEAETKASDDFEKPVQVQVTLLQSSLEVSHPYLVVRYLQEGAAPESSGRWSPSDQSKSFNFTWLPRKALRFELLRVSETGAELLHFGKSGPSCVVDLFDESTAPGANGEYGFAKDKNTVRLRVTYDDPDRVKRLRSVKPRAPDAEFPLTCVEIRKTGR